MLKPTASLTQQLEYFQLMADFYRRAALNVALMITRIAKERGLPLEPSALLTKSRGQIAGLSGPAVARILRDHGLDAISAEGGRTSRGSIYYMQRYVAFLNDLLPDIEPSDLDAVEAYWADQVRRGMWEGGPADQ